MNSKEIKRESLAYRPNVSIIAKRDNKFLLFNRPEWDEDSWKFPQGGVDGNEEPSQTAKREFLEEFGTDKIKILKVSKIENKYEWSDNVLKEHLKAYGKIWHRGQKQKYVLIEVLCQDNEFRPDKTEISKFRWATKEEILDLEKNNYKTFSDYNGVISKIFEEFEL